MKDYLLRVLICVLTDCSAPQVTAGGNAWQENSRPSSASAATPANPAGRSGGWPSLLSRLGHQPSGRSDRGHLRGGAPRLAYQFGRHPCHLGRRSLSGRDRARRVSPQGAPCWLVPSLVAAVATLGAMSPRRRTVFALHPRSRWTALRCLPRRPFYPRWR
jgi:hypothetical protein